MLKITFLELPGNSTILRLDGRLVGPWVKELEKYCQQVLSRGSHLTLDLGGISFIGRAGIALLQGLKDRQVALTNYSPFIAEQLRGVAILGEAEPPERPTASEGNQSPKERPWRRPVSRYIPKLS